MKSFLIAALVLLMAATSFASGEFSTGSAELLTFKGTGYFRFDLYGQEEANPENNMSSFFTIDWLPKLNDFVDGKINLELSSNNGNIKLADMFLNLNFTENLSLMGGQFKVPFGYANTRSSSSMYFADRAYISSVGDYKNYAARDNGICLVASFEPVTVDLALFNGTGNNSVSDNDENNQFAARASVEAASWITFGGAYTTIGQPEIEDTTGTTESFRSSGIDVFAVVKYPMGETAKLFFEGEYAMLGRTGAEEAGMEMTDGSCMSVAAAAEFAVGDGFLRTVRPAVRYDMVNPSTNLAVGADEPENNVNVIDFCVAMDLTSSKNTLMLGARNYGFENEEVDGYTNMYLNWRMNF
ncbi:MAG: porin [Candidatus Fermentibacteraceae bacterium]